VKLKEVLSELKFSLCPDWNYIGVFLKKQLNVGYWKRVIEGPADVDIVVEFRN
jgi:hypothetical protein